ncbi:hypothetical protein ACTXT7_010253 [Hymenolepis weldensis]
MKNDEGYAENFSVIEDESFNKETDNLRDLKNPGKPAFCQMRTLSYYDRLELKLLELRVLEGSLIGGAIIVLTEAPNRWSYE